jgi:hypothetical protein
MNRLDIIAQAGGFPKAGFYGTGADRCVTRCTVGLRFASKSSGPRAATMLALKLLQLGVFGLGLLENGDVGVGVLP